MNCYLDLKQIENLASGKDVFRRGTEYYREGRVSEIDATEAEGSSILSMNVEGNSSSYKVRLGFDEQGNLKRYSCSCDAAMVWRGACKHIIAAMVNVFEHNRRSVIISKTLRNSKNLLRQYEKQAYEEIDQNLKTPSGSQISLVPSLSILSCGLVNLTFKIGRKKMYILKNVLQFLSDIESGSTVSYGKDLEFEHKTVFFDECSSKLIKLMQSELNRFVRLSKILNNNSFQSDSKFSGREMPLSPEGLDVFFDIFENTDIDVSIDSIDFCMARFTREKPEVRFKITPAEKEIGLECNNSAVHFLEGEQGRYILDSGFLRLVDKRLYNALYPVFQTLKLGNTKQLLFQKSDSNRINAFLLPALKEFGLIEETDIFREHFEGFLLKKKVYLDAEGRYALCRVIFSYGSLEFDPYTENENLNLPSRDIAGEYRFRALLGRVGFIYDSEKSALTINNDDQLYDFLGVGLAELRDACEVYLTDEFMKLSSRPSKLPSLGMRLSGNLLKVDIKSEEYSNEELLDILEALRSKKKYHRLSDGRFIDLKEKALEVFSDTVEGLGISEKQIENGTAELPKYRIFYADESEDLGDFNDELKNLLADFKNYRNLDFDLPQKLSGILRSYQEEGFKWLKTLAKLGFGGILADDMGLGKTLQVISLLLSEKEKGPSIVVAPTSLVYNWEKEIARFSPDLKTCVISGIASKRADILKENGTADVFITTYDLLKRDIENYEDVNFNYVIADEAQYIKNPTTQNARALKTLRANTRFALTGTPIENSLTELWSIFDFIMPGYLSNYSKFSKTFENPIIRYEDDKASVALKKQISPFILRRLKSDVLTELPEKIETTLYAEMPDEQKKLYSAFLLRAKNMLQETVKTGHYKENQIQILSQLTRLRQICCHPAVFVEGYAGGSGKLDLTLQTVKSSTEAGHRLLIFSQFTSMLQIIAAELEKEEIGYFYLDGATPSERRLQMAERFNAGENSVFLISLKAGGTGLNLTGADIVIHYDPWWNPAVMEQASDRAHRFGQEKTVQVINIVAKDSIEEKIIALQAKKRDLIDNVIEEGANFINKMSEEDIVNLFN